MTYCTCFYLPPDNKTSQRKKKRDNNMYILIYMTSFSSSTMNVHSTLQLSVSIRAMMEFLKLVPAVTGRFVTSILDLAPSGHMELMREFSLKHGGGGGQGMRNG